ncbi:unnamed protein product [Sympodiomycopsis kandeliae]
MAIFQSSPYVEIASLPTTSNAGPSRRYESSPPSSSGPIPALIGLPHGTLRSLHNVPVQVSDNSSRTDSSAATSKSPSEETASRQLRKSSYRKPFKVDWDNSRWAQAARSHPLSSHQVGWAALTCPPAEPSQDGDDASFSDPRSQAASSSSSFWIDQAYMPQASNYPWGPMKIPPDKKIKISRRLNLPAVYHDINDALHVDEEYDSRIVQRVIYRDMGMSESEFDRESIAGLGRSIEDSDRLSSRSRSRQLSVAASSILGGADDESYHVMVDPRQHAHRGSTADQDTEGVEFEIDTGDHSTDLPSMSIPTTAADETIAKAGPAEAVSVLSSHPDSLPGSVSGPVAAPSSPDFFVEFDVQPTRDAPISIEETSPRPSPIPAAGSPTASSSRPIRPKRIAPTRGSRLSAASMSRLNKRPKRDDNPPTRRSPRRRDSLPSVADSDEVAPQRFDLSGWAQPPTRLGSRAVPQPFFASDAQNSHQPQQQQQQQPNPTPSSRQRQNETSSTGASSSSTQKSRTRFLVPALDDDDESRGSEDEFDYIPSNKTVDSQPTPTSSSTSSNRGRQALLSHSWMARSSQQQSQLQSRNHQSAKKPGSKNEPILLD